MNNAEWLPEQIAEAKKQCDLAELQLKVAELRLKTADLDNQLPYSQGYLPVESPRKYGAFEDVKDEDRGEIEGLFGIIDRSELLLCELATTRSAAVVGTRQPEQRMTPKAEPKRVGRKLNYPRSALKRAILVELTKNPDAKDRSICNNLDENGTEVPHSWEKNGDRTFEAVYLDAKRKRNIESAISKVRSDMREAGLLSPPDGT